MTPIDLFLLPPSLLLAAFAAQLDSGLSRLSILGASMSRSNWPTESSAKRGYDARWRRLRAHVLARDDHLCQCTHCKADGRTTLATEVDHIVSRARAKALGWTNERAEHPNNLQAINSDCHVRKTQEEQGKTVKPKRYIGADGFPIT
jgi:5-methylcytosine-specific restriction protein A